jgi:hypothetical protein
VAERQVDYARTQALFEDIFIMPLGRHLENTWGVARLLNTLGRLACYQGNYERAALTGRPH